MRGAWIILALGSLVVDIEWCIGDFWACELWLMLDNLDEKNVYDSVEIIVLAHSPRSFIHSGDPKETQILVQRERTF